MTIVELLALPQLRKMSTSEALVILTYISLLMERGWSEEDAVARVLPTLKGVRREPYVSRDRG